MHIATFAVVAALIAAPAQAADWRIATTEARAGAFVGVRLRLPLGGSSPRPQAALTIAPTQSRFSADGRIVTRIGDGLSLDFASRKPMLRLGGARADLALGLGRQEQVDANRKSGLSKGAWIGIGVGVVAVAVVILVANFTCVGEDPEFCGSD